MKRLLPLTAILVCTLFPLSAGAACPTSSPNPLAYVRRDNNRCEGLRDGKDASGSLSLISFVSSNLKDISNPLPIRVPGSTSPILEVQEFSRNYRLDEVKMQPSGNGSAFSLNSRILQNAGITKPESLFAVAYVIRDGSPIYYPTFFGKASSQYTFVLYTEKPTAFKKIQVRRQGSSTLVLDQSFRQPRTGSILVQWRYDSAPTGNYELYLEDSQGEVSRFPFKHNRQWL
jgi:hypothetical protein